MAQTDPNKVCGPKRKHCYPTKAVAKMKAAQGKKNGAPPLRVYQCPECRDWHLTSKV